MLLDRIIVIFIFLVRHQIKSVWFANQVID
jgi:hypothetical protein